MRARVQYLEERVQLLDKKSDEAQGGGGSGSSMTFSGLVEVEAASGKNREGVSSSDVVLSTVELAAEAHLNAWTHAQVVYLFEEDATEPGEIDQAILTLGNAERSPIYLSAGRMYLPFGNFESGMVSDPLTLELAEIRESALQLGFDSAGFYGSLYAFNGDTAEAGEDDGINHFGANLGFAGEHFDIGAGYLSTLADSDANQELIEPFGAMQENVPGVAAHVIIERGPFTVIGEYVGANRDFASTDPAFPGEGARPSAWNLELDYSFQMMGKEASLGVARQRTSEAVALELPKSKTLATFSVALFEATALSLEYAMAEDYSLSDGGSGESGGVFTVQLATEF
ncbi:MAG: LbtU family siderophore porin [Gammaproteobacteria bacterium]|nr:LbtU family siderophore porin [Gammaproteobacteria bacterium]MCW8957880.1 LbtU family siderophore porin [Gammaproteobacteria bacterium]MCW8972392.1 LbtU family siderophore porin [Gammaproteobacteria bacterium]MCW8992642.1 LbtU family siderophore porin [Gammaproteobacteria bacterium]MCW9088771.1 LbtU family siderophore porin [Gammaproteobacteria bacterium]